MLILTIKKKWYEMILNGEKKEEYREIKPYYTTRFANALDIGTRIISSRWWHKEIDISNKKFEVMFRNGYSADSPSFTATVSISIGTGREEWGAEPDREYYVLRILGRNVIKNGQNKD